MKYTLLLITLFACKPTENLLGDTGDYENLLNSSPEENELIPIDGQWSVSNPQSVSDACGVNSYQDVTEMVPSKFAVKDGTLSSFNTDDTNCEIGNGGAFVCKETRGSQWQPVFTWDEMGQCIRSLP